MPGVAFIEMKPKDMRDSDLEKLLDQIRQERVPSCPSGVETKVLRGIRQLRPVGERSFDFLTWTSFSRLLGGVAACALALGMVAGMALHSRNEPVTARSALGLDVFHADAPGLPNQLLVQL